MKRWFEVAFISAILLFFAWRVQDWGGKTEARVELVSAQLVSLREVPGERNGRKRHIQLELAPNAGTRWAVLSYDLTIWDAVQVGKSYQWGVRYGDAHHEVLSVSEDGRTIRNQTHTQQNIEALHQQGSGWGSPLNLVLQALLLARLVWLLRGPSD